MPNTAPQVGQVAPDFNLKGPGGQRISLSEHKGHQHVLLVFYPLAFSPTCSHQLPEIQTQAQRLTELGTAVLGISVDAHWSNTAFAERLGLSFPLLSDWERDVSKAYGVYLPGPAYSNRALFLVDKEGNVAYSKIQDDIDEIPDIDKVVDVLKTLA